MARFDEPVMNTRRRAPADNASSTAYWMSGLSTMGSISLGLALVAGRKRVPRPATGNTATSTRLFFMAAPALFGGQNHTTPPFPALQATDPGAREFAQFHDSRGHGTGFLDLLVRTPALRAWLPADWRVPD